MKSSSHEDKRMVSTNFIWNFLKLSSANKKEKDLTHGGLKRSSLTSQSGGDK
jgi:hypothetical protein